MVDRLGAARNTRAKRHSLTHQHHAKSVDSGDLLLDWLAMPYVYRDSAGTINAMHKQAAAGDEFLPDDHADVLAFVGLGKNHTEGGGFVRMDAGFVRVIEDVIDALIVKNVINITDLPTEAQIKLMDRRSFRERVSQNSLRLFEGGGTGRVV
jgi:hypothetical protein